MVLDKIPTEILLQIGKSVSSEKDLGSLVLTNRHIHKTLNAVLYDLNLNQGKPRRSCVIWGAKNNSLATIKRAKSYGANLDVHDPQVEPRAKIEWPRMGKRSERRIFSPLHAAVMKGFHEVTRYLLDNGATVDMPSIGLCSCLAWAFNPLIPAWFPLHTALCHAKDGHVSSEMLIRHGARKEARASPGLSFRTVEYQPSLAGIVASLGGLGECNRDNEVWGPIQLAASIGMDDVPAMRFERPERNERANVTSHGSVMQQNVGTTKLLLDAPGAEVEAVDCSSRNAVFDAARGENDRSVASIISLLVKGGANINLPDETGMTPLYAAASRPFLHEYPNFMAVEALLAHCADPFLFPKNHNGWSIFHQLFRSAPDIKEVVRPRRAALTRLIELGVDFDTRCSQSVELAFDSDATPLFYAAAHAQDPECVKILLKAGARPDTTVLNREVINVHEQSFLSGFFRHIWETPTRRRSPSLRKAGKIIAMLLKYGSRLEDVNGEESPLGFACRYSEIRTDYALLDFLLEHATRKNVSLERLENIIAKIRRRYERSEGEVEVADRYNIAIHKLQTFREKIFPGEGMNEMA